MSKHDMSKHEQNVSLLMEKIEDADAICVGAASFARHGRALTGVSPEHT